MSNASAAFGRRGVAAASGRRATTAARTPGTYSSHQVALSYAGQNGSLSEVRFTSQVNWVALVILIGAFNEGMDLTSDTPGMNMIPLTSFDPLLFKIAVAIAGMVGIAWLWQGLMGSVALRMDNSAVTGFTLLGRKRIAWRDIERIEIKEHETYGDELIIHAGRSSPSGSYLWLNCIPVMLKSVDRTREEIIDAIRARRPDLAL